MSHMSFNTYYKVRPYLIYYINKTVKILIGSNNNVISSIAYFPFITVRIIYSYINLLIKIPYIIKNNPSMFTGFYLEFSIMNYFYKYQAHILKQKKKKNLISDGKFNAANWCHLNRYLSCIYDKAPIIYKISFLILFAFQILYIEYYTSGNILYSFLLLSSTLFTFTGFRNQNYNIIGICFIPVLILQLFNGTFSLVLIIGVLISITSITWYMLSVPIVLLTIYNTGTSGSMILLLYPLFSLVPIIRFIISSSIKDISNVSWIFEAMGINNRRKNQFKRINFRILTIKKLTLFIHLLIIFANLVL